MPKRELCLGLWGQIFQDTKSFAHQVLDKLIPHNKASSSSCSTYSGLTIAKHGRTMDQLQPHHHQQQEQQQYSSSQEQQQQLSSRHHQQQQRKQAPHQYQQHQPLSPHCKEIYTPYRHVYYSSTLSINIRTTSSSSCTSLTSTLNSSSFSSLTSSGGGQEQEYESLWEVQLALREIPGMIEGNILESCQQDSTAGVETKASISSNNILSPPLPLPQQKFQPHTSTLSYDSADTPPQSSSLRHTFATMEEFPRFPSSASDDSDVDNYYCESDDDEEEKVNEVESFTFQPFPLQPFPLQPLRPHPFLQLYSPCYNNSTTAALDLPFTTTEHNSNSINRKYNTGSISLSTEPHSPRNEEEEEEEEEETALTFSRRQFRSSNNSNTATLFNVNENPLANTNNGHGNPRSDRKDSGVFITDAEDGTIVKISPRSTYSLSSSSSASESESESDTEHIDDSCYHQRYRPSKDLSRENTDLSSHWMNGVCCISSNDNTNTNSSNVRGGGGARDDANKSSKATLQRRENTASTPFPSPPSTASTAMTFASASASASSTATASSSTFPSLMAAVSFISLQV